MKGKLAICFLVLILLVISLAAFEQTSLTTYSCIAKSRFVGNMTVHSYRDGNRALVQLTGADPSTLNIKNFYDFAAHRLYTLDMNSKVCTTVAYTSPYPPPLNDVVAMAEDMRKQLTAAKVQPKPGETIAGQPTQIYEVRGPEASMKVWVDTKYGVPLRYQMAPKGSQPITVSEVEEIKFTAPPAETFTFPTNCQKLEGTTDAIGGHVSTK